MFLTRFQRLFYFTFIIFVCNKNYIKLSSSSLSSHSTYFNEITNKIKTKSNSNLYSISKFFSYVKKDIIDKSYYNKNKVSSKDKTEPIIQKNRVRKSNKIYSIEQQQRHAQEVCDALTCVVKAAVSLRIIPYQDKISDVETLLTGCALPDTIKQFKQKGKEMFVAKVCFGNIKNLMAVKKKGTIIEKLEGGTKSSKSKMIRKKPKVIVQRQDCDGGCCKDCPDHKVKTVVLTTTNYKAVSTLVDGCVLGKNPRKYKVDKVEKYVFDMCRNDKFVLKRNEAVEGLKTYKDRNFFKCKRACDESTSLEDAIAVTDNLKSMDYVEDCAFADSFDRSNIVQEGDTFSINIKICSNDRLNLYTMMGIESVLPVCAIHNALSISCGAGWAKAAPVCCDGLECEGKRCIDGNITDPTSESGVGPDNNSTALDYPEDMNSEDTEACVEGTCCKTCVISDATQEGQYPQTYPDQVMNVLFETSSGKGQTFASSCTTTEVIYVSPNIYSTTICKDDFDTIQNDGRIQAIEEEQIVTTPGDEDIETEIPGDEEEFEEQEQCGRDTCCKSCSTPDAPTDADQLMNALVTVSGFDAISLLDSCMIDLTGDIYVDESGNTVHPMTICKDDFDTLNNNDRIQSIVEDIPGDEPKDNDTNSASAGSDFEEVNNIDLTDPPTVNDYPGGKDEQTSQTYTYTATLNPNSTWSSTYSETLVPELDKTSADEDNNNQEENNSTSIDEMSAEDNSGENTDLGISSEPACAEGTCCKTCVISDATEEGQFPETDPDQVMDVLFEVTSGKGQTFASSCTTTEVINAENGMYAMEICKDDFDTLQNDGRIKSIE